MFKSVCRVAIRLMLFVLIVSIGILGFVITQGRLLPRSKTITIDESSYNIENTINIAQIRELDDLDKISSIFHSNGEGTLRVGMKGSILTINIDNNGEVIQVNRNDDIDISNRVLEAKYSPNGRYIDLSDYDSHYIYDVQSHSKYIYGKGELYGKWSETGNVLIKYNMKELGNFLEVYDISGDKLHSIELPHNYERIDTNSLFSHDGSDIYLTSRAVFDDKVYMGIFKINMSTGDIQELYKRLYSEKKKVKNPGTDPIEHPGEYIDVHIDNRVYNYTLLGDRILFDGIYDGISGLFMYDLDEERVYTLIESDGAIAYSIAPDRNRIVFTINKILYNTENGLFSKIFRIDKSPRSQPTNSTNIYVANIGNKSLSNITYIRRDVFATDYKWSNDSKTLYYLKPDIGKIDRIRFK